MAEIDYYFTSSSPWVYLGHAAIRAVAQRHGARLNPRPVQLGGVWEVSGAVPLAQRTPTRQRYRFLELQRFAELRCLPIVYRPKAAPLDPDARRSHGGGDPGRRRRSAGFHGEPVFRLLGRGPRTSPTRR